MVYKMLTYTNHLVLYIEVSGPGCESLGKSPTVFYASALN